MSHRLKPVLRLLKGVGFHQSCSHWHEVSIPSLPLTSGRNRYTFIQNSCGNVEGSVPMRSIFISYRREDAEGEAGRLFDDLTGVFGEHSVFMDVAGIQMGRDFRKAIDESVATCGVLLAVIGRQWVEAKDETGRRRLDNPLDFVRLETASA